VRAISSARVIAMRGLVLCPLEGAPLGLEGVTPLGPQLMFTVGQFTVPLAVHDEGNYFRPCDLSPTVTILPSCPPGARASNQLLLAAF
jgi:hypothetical protein